MSNGNPFDADAIGDQADQDLPLTGQTDVKRESNEQLQGLADEHGVALIAYIGPYMGVRVSPVHYITASITFFDEFGIETVINELVTNNITKAYFLINSFGGQMGAAYKIAKVLRQHLNEITTFVPHIAASGGTLLALTGNTIVMGPFGNITSLDPQVLYNGMYMSATSGQKALTKINEFYKTATVEEVPYPCRALADKLDPLILTEWTGIITTAQHYISNILTLAGYDKEKAQDIALQLIWRFPTHGFAITAEVAREIGLVVEDSTKHEAAWQQMRAWLGNYLFERQGKSYIRYVIPESQRQSRTSEKRREQKNERTKEEKGEASVTTYAGIR